jgi:hypothetical protein
MSYKGLYGFLGFGMESEEREFYPFGRGILWLESLPILL